MEAALTGLVAILAAAAGAWLTYLLQRKSASRAEAFEQMERLRIERIAAYGAFAAAAMEFRRAQHERWYGKHDGDDRRGAAAKDESYRRRSEAWQAFYRGQLIADDDELFQIARRAMEETSAVHKPGDQTAMEQQADRARDALEAFISAARKELGVTMRPHSG